MLLEKISIKSIMQLPNPYLDHLIDPSFHGVNRLFVLLIENSTDRTLHTKLNLSNCRKKGL